jgi:hypothetical protein
VLVKKKKNRHCAAFDSERCSQCPNQAVCPARPGKKHYYLRYTEKEMRIAKRRMYEQTDAFKDRYRWRSGVEATMSEYDRRTGVKRLRVRGLKAVRFCATLKALGINLLRAAIVWMAVYATPEQDKSAGFSPDHVSFIVKERFLAIWRRIQYFFEEIMTHNRHILKIWTVLSFDHAAILNPGNLS